MCNPKPVKPPDSTPVEPDWRKLRLKFFLSLCLFGFLAGMMLRQLTGTADAEHNRLLSISQQAASLELCFAQPPQVRTHAELSAMWSIAPVAATQRQQGELRMAQDEVASWILLWRDNSLQLGITALGQLHTQWRYSNDSCVLFVVSRQT